MLTVVPEAKVQQFGSLEGRYLLQFFVWALCNPGRPQERCCQPDANHSPKLNKTA